MNWIRRVCVCVCVCVNMNWIRRVCVCVCVLSSQLSNICELDSLLNRNLIGMLVSSFIRLFNFLK